MKLSLAALVLVSLASEAATAPAIVLPVPGLVARASCSGFAPCFIAKGKLYFGTTSGPSGTLGGSSISSNQTASFKAQFNQLTPEDSMKWDTIEPSKGSFNFGAGNTLVNYAQSNGIIVRGHTFIWHSQLPSWVSSITNSSTLTSVIQNHIAKEAGQWKGKIYAWDVCNEILNEDGSMRSSVFYNVLGDSFVKIAFAAARSADPVAKLYIDDYNLDSPSYGKTVSMIAKVKAWKAAGVQIDGIGGSSTSQAALTALAGSGVSEVAMTELSISGNGQNDWITAIKACLAVTPCVGITLWSTSDFFDADFKPKPLYTAVIAALQAL